MNSGIKTDQVNLKRLVREVKSAADTPAIISFLAENPDLLQMVFRILTVAPVGDPGLFKDLDDICSQEEFPAVNLKKRLTPAASALGLPEPEEATGDFYEVLGVSLDASETAIRKAYLTKARDLHPDIHPHINPREFALLAEAYRVLSDPDLRKAYDARHQKKDVYWAERSPAFMEQAEREIQGHQRQRRRVVFQLVLLVVAMIIGIGIAVQFFEEQSLRDGPSVQTLPGSGSGVGGRESDVRGRMSDVGGRRAGGGEQGAGSREEGKARPSKAPDEPGASVAETSAPARTSSPTQALPSKDVLGAPPVKAANSGVLNTAGPSSGPGKDGSPDERKMLAELEAKARKVSRQAPVEPARTPGSAAVTSLEMEKKRGRDKEVLAAAKVQEPGAKSEEPSGQKGKERDAGMNRPAAASPSVEPPAAESPPSGGRAPVKEAGPSTATDQPDRPGGSLPPDVDKILTELGDMAWKEEAQGAGRKGQGAGSREEGKARPSKAPDEPGASVAETSVPDVTGPASGPDDTGSSRPVKVLAKVEDSGIKAQGPTPNEPTRKAESVTVTPSGLGKKVEQVEKEATAATPEERTGEPTAVPLDRIQDFLEAYCRAYETLNYSRFMGFFAKDAVENDRSVKQLEATYRDNFERLDALTYDIQVEGRRVEPEEIEVTGHYRLQWRFQGQDWQKREGSIVLGLIPAGKSFQVKRLVYR